MTTRFYICDASASKEISIYKFNDDWPMSFGTRTNALPQFSRQAVRELLNSIIKMLGDSKYELYAIQRHHAKDIVGYEVVIHEEDSEIQFKLTWC